MVPRPLIRKLRKMAVVKLTDRTAKTAAPRSERYELCDGPLKGLSLRVGSSGAKTWYFLYRGNEGGRMEAKKRFRLGTFPALGADEARRLARAHRASVERGEDPAEARAKRRGAVTVATLAEEFLLKKDLKPRTRANYADILDRIVLPAIGNLKVDAVTPEKLAKLHRDWSHTASQANRMLAVVSSMYSYGGFPNTLVPPGYNPTVKIPRNKEVERSFRLTPTEMARLGAAIREAETLGVKWTIKSDKPGVKHLGKAACQRRTVVNPAAAAAIRILIFTGARLREILHLRWSEVDLDEGVLTLPDSKSGKKVIVLNAPAIDVLKGLPRVSQFVIPGEPRLRADGTLVDAPRADLQRPWTVIRSLAGLDHLRLHDLRHSFATKALNEGKELLVVSKLLGHSRLETTRKYVHLATRPMKRASNSVGSRIAKELGEGRLR